MTKTHAKVFGSPILFWFTIGLHGFAVCVITIVLYIYISAYCRNKQSKSIHLFIKMLTIIGSVASISCAITNGLTVYIDGNERHFNNKWYQFQAMSHVFNNMMTYSIYIYRLHLSFNETMFKISRKTFFILILCIVTDFVSYMAEAIVYTLHLPNKTLIYVDGVGLVAEILITVICLSLFNVKLFRLITRMRTSIIDAHFTPPLTMKNKKIQKNSSRSRESSSSLSGFSKSEINLNERQETMINRIVRNALLCSITITIWVIERNIWFIFVFNKTGPTQLFSNNGMLIAKCTTAIALITDAYCMLFTFRFASKLYRLFCIKCDTCCATMCRLCARRYLDQYERFVDNQAFI
eukprot:110978_1